ncbi:unnamed protein product [Bursaphelenchus xylophilus]|uniref:Kinesin-like protein n=1 Tax=Bursaphelenchus xylophilus TaxID=6326 RepID=A0A1I7RZ80_BURXY|nr:unnamed protein product [Bursaphelenchus xylophilus]CAG9106760.1 unnamed protein product [Bursaphelenchus xylophilus]
MGADKDNVIVAVRVRPFNDREKQRNAQLIINMPNNTVTEIRDPNNPNDEPKRFTFDHSYWSHDGYKTEKNGYFSPANEKYADQKKVFDDLGKGVLDNAWKGYNCSLFAYGQTGSGKSYSIVGFNKNKGIVPMVCEDLFKRIDKKKEENPEIEYQVSISMLEIYCERIRDLLNPTPPPKGGLKLREHPKTGFYVEGLSSSPVNSYKEIEAKINEGTKSRTIAATNMNATSSRAHTIVKLQFVQKTAKKGGEGATTKTSEINLVDLAGSERQKDAGSEGDRLKEGIVINQSLSTLGRVIKALHDKQNSKRTVQVPYRDSVLTSLLKNALGGNSRTIMIAAISPADINYEETLSTLRFADRAKSIKTMAVVNESATERQIRELREENEKLAKLIKKGAVDGSAASQDELESLKQQLAENQKAMEDLEKSWQERLNEERKKYAGEDRAEIEAKRKTVAHMWNLNEDPALTDMVVHFIPEGENRVGNGQNGQSANIVLKGLSIQPEHAIIRNKDNKKFTIQPIKGADIMVNGKPVVGEVALNQNDRVHFGGNHLYVFVNPKKGGIKTNQEITYEMAQKEIAKNVGITGGLSKGKSKSGTYLEEDLINLLPNVYRANAMAKELKRNVNFEIVLMAPEARGQSDGDTEICVRVTNKSDDTTFLWDEHKFMNRYYGMSEMYQSYMDNDPQWNLPRDKDPFYESTDSSVDVGTATVYLRSLAFLVEVEENYPINDIQGSEAGQLSVALTPCNANGKEILGEFVEDPMELVGQNLGFKVKILTGLNLPRRVKETWCRYRFFDREETSTQKAKGNNPAFAHEELFMFKPVSKELVEYLRDQALCITVCATQRIKENEKHTAEVVEKINNYLDEGKAKKRSKSKNSVKSARRKSKDGKENKKEINGNASFNGSVSSKDTAISEEKREPRAAAERPKPTLNRDSKANDHHDRENGKSKERNGSAKRESSKDRRQSRSTDKKKRSASEKRKSSKSRKKPSDTKSN